MTRTVWRYEIPTNTPTTLMIPKGFKVLHFTEKHTEDDKIPMFWAEVDPDAEKIEVKVLAVGTGWNWNRLYPVVYLGTLFELGGEFVWHYYLEIRDEVQDHD